MGELAVTEGTTFYRRGDTGLVELVDARTGAVVRVQKTANETPSAEFTSMEIDGKTVLVQNAIDLATLQFSKKYPFSKPVADLIVQLIIEGTPISRIVNTPNMPSLYTLARWRRESPDFEADIQFARKMRAERLRDEALEEANLASGVVSEYVAGHKLKVDTLKWAAEKDSPSEYGAKMEVKGTIGHVHMVIETGIRRPGDTGAVPPVLTEATVVDSGNPGDNNP